MVAAVGARSVMLAAGGSGGHLFPAFALAQELGRRAIAVDLVTDMRADRYGAEFPARAVYRVPSATFAGRTLLGSAGAGWMLVRGIRAAFKLLGEVRPAAVVGFGGYPAFPPLVAARLRRIPTAVHEQNAVLGRSNRMLAAYVSAIATSFDPTQRLAKTALGRVRLTGNPVRDVVIDWAGQAYAPPASDGPYSLLVFGGSQGARFFSEVMPPALALLPEQMRSALFVVQQCREEDLGRVESAYSAAGIRAHLATFFTNLPEEMAKAHLVIGRAGASTVAELTVIGRPAILVPLPHAIDNDQLNNARRLAESGGAWCIEQGELTAERMAGAIGRVFATPDLLVQAAASAKRQGRPDAVVRLADLVEELVGNRSRKA
jgi:UDP-N-acetylglucosamine--N-acetylmuramyl-(pentapeptide) pyrophosphoryl-undecaprenol N-acetylglucosamine transferase